MNRRKFLELSTTAAACGLISGCSTRSMRRVSPNGTISHACIGVTGMGKNDLENFRTNPKVQIVAICDVDRNHLEQAAAVVPQARRYADWREMLAREGDRIDSLNVTVPDHMHAPIAMTAMRAGKHVYCQKPLCHEVAECRAIASAAQSAGVVTQLGTQFASGLGDRMVVRWLRDGVLGPVKRVILCSNRPGATEAYRLLGPKPAGGASAPETLNWDLWLGSAPERSFAPEIYHPMKWRSWQDFGTGWSGDIGCHLFDAIWKGLGLTAPLTVTAKVQQSWVESPTRRADTWPQSNHITWLFPGNEKTGGKNLTVEWFDGEFYPPEEALALGRVAGFQRYPAESSLVLGENGALLSPLHSGPILLPKDRFQGVARPELKPRSHYDHFIEACMGAEMTESHFRQTGPMTEAILLGTIAVRAPEVVLQWDAHRMNFTNSPGASRYLSRKYRRGWEVAGLSKR